MSEAYRFIVGQRTAEASAGILDSLNVKPEHELLAALAATSPMRPAGGSSYSESNGVVTVSVPDIRSIFDPGRFTQGPEQVHLGRRIFIRWSSELRELVCGSGQEDQQLQRDILRALTGKEGGATAIIAVLIAKQFNLDASTAALVAALTVRLVAKPMVEEICKSWSLALTEGN